MWALLGYSALHRYRERQAHFVKLLESSCKPISPFVGGVRTARYRFVLKGRPIIAILAAMCHWGQEILVKK